MAKRTLETFAQIAIAMTISLASTGPSLAASIAKHTTIELDAAGNITAITETVAHGNGDLLLLTYGVDVAASSSAAAGSPVNTTSSRGALSDKMVFLAETQEVISVDRGQCQKFGPNSEAPGGMSMGDMSQYQQEMQAAQAEMEKAFEEMAKTNPQMAEQMRKSFGNKLGNNPMARPRDELELIDTGEKGTFEKYTTEKFQVRNVRTGEIKHTVWAARIDDVDGGELIGRNMSNMYSVFQSYMDKMGVGALGSSSIVGAIGDKMKTHYPVWTIDHEDNHQTKLQTTRGKGPDTIEVNCNN